MGVNKTLATIRKNGMIVLGAVILACGIFYVVHNPQSFLASILSLQEQQFIAQKWRDIAYKTDSGYIDIFLAQKVQTPTSIDFTITFDKKTVTIDPTSITGQGTWSYTMPDQGDIIIHAVPAQSMDKTQSLIMLPFSGDIEHILLSEATAESSDGTQQNLSVWSLNTLTSHSEQ